MNVVVFLCADDCWTTGRVEGEYLKVEGIAWIICHDPSIMTAGFIQKDEHKMAVTKGRVGSAMPYYRIAPVDDEGIHRQMGKHSMSDKTLYSIHQSLLRDFKA